MSYSKLGFHYSASGGNKQGISNFWQSLSNAGIPIFHKCSDAYGDLYEIDQLTPNPHNIQHNLIYRLSTAGQNNGIQYDVPDYSKTPYNAALEHWNNTKAILPPEFNKNTVWLELVNEIDKNRSDWIGMFAVEIATLANNAGFKVLLPAWSSGEPEPEHWNGIKPYLQYCASKPNKAAVSGHEYDLGIEGFDAVYPYHYGRFQWCFDYCDRNNIPRPNVYITEWGWSLNDVPLWNDVLDTINKANELYCKYPQIKGCAIWNLGGGWNNIANKVQKYIVPLTQYTLSKTFYEGGLNEPLDPNYFDNQIVSNYLQNSSFENNWYHVNGIQEIQIPNNWGVWYTDVTGTYKTFAGQLERIGDYIPNPHDNNVWSQFVRYEMRVLPKSQLPLNEQDLFVLHGNYTNKTFKGFGAWHGGLFQNINLESGTYKLTIKVFADLVVGYSGGQKVWATDPLSGLVRFNNGDFESLIAGEWNILEYEFEASGNTELKIDFMLPFALNNSGLFMDDWKLEKVESDCNCGAIGDIRSTIMWIPQYSKLTNEQKQQIFDWAENGFPMPDGTMTSGEHPITSSHSEALKIHVNGLHESVLAVVYPSLIGTGVTIEWLNNNCPAVFCDNKKVVFLGENQFQFDHVPVIYR